MAFKVNDERFIREARNVLAKVDFRPAAEQTQILRQRFKRTELSDSCIRQLVEER